MATSSVVLAAGLFAACVPRPQMCTASNECGAKGACVAGRCQVENARLKPAVDTARRLVVRPTDIGYTAKANDRASDGLPSVVALGRDGGKLLLRFSLTLPPTANIVEAYVVLRRSSVVDDDPTPTSLHASRIVEPWSSGTVAWALQPGLSETRSPVTTVEPGARTLVRLDVRDLVRGWSRRDRSDEGIAIVADGESRTGTTFALSGLGVEGDAPQAPLATRLGTAGPVVDPEPYLEIYLR